MKKLRRFFAVFVFLILMFIINEFFRYLLIDDTSSLTRIMMHEFYAEDKNIDILFIGSSHCYRSLNPEITDEIFQKNTFNAGSSLQGLDATYALLVEAGRKNNLEEVYVEIYYGISQEVFDEREDLTATYLISDYMKHGLNRFFLLLNAGSSEHYVNSFILARRNADKILDINWISELLSKKRSKKYRNYEYDYGYMGKGFVGSDIYLTQDELHLDKRPPKITEECITGDCKKYMKKIIAYCEKNHIKLTFFTAPMHDFVIMTQEGYDLYARQIQTIIDKTSAQYVDFNLCRREVLDLQSEDYLDSHHLNTKGAEKFSRVFAEYFSNGGENDIFYNSYAEKIQAMPEQVMGLVIAEKHTEQGKTTYAIEPVMVGDLTLEYEISFYPENGEGEYLQDWSENTDFALPLGEKGELVVEYRIKGTKEPVHYIKKEY